MKKTWIDENTGTKYFITSERFNKKENVIKYMVRYERQYEEDGETKSYKLTIGYETLKTIKKYYGYKG